MKESESKQECCGLDMPNGLHTDGNRMKYPQSFVKAPLSMHPSKALSNGKESDSSEIMNMVCHAS